MADKSPHSPSPGVNGEEKPRLTEEEKKQNHIASGMQTGREMEDGLLYKCA
jgi:hypothetical protein